MSKLIKVWRHELQSWEKKNKDRLACRYKRDISSPVFTSMLCERRTSPVRRRKSHEKHLRGKRGSFFVWKMRRRRRKRQSWETAIILKMKSQVKSTRRMCVCKVTLLTFHTAFHTTHTTCFFTLQPFLLFIHCCCRCRLVCPSYHFHASKNEKRIILRHDDEMRGSDEIHRKEKNQDLQDDDACLSWHHSCRSGCLSLSHTLWSSPETKTKKMTSSRSSSNYQNDKETRSTVTWEPKSESSPRRRDHRSDSLIFHFIFLFWLSW